LAVLRLVMRKILPEPKRPGPGNTSLLWRITEN
jgi:hypothetical protein